MKKLCRIAACFCSFLIPMTVHAADASLAANAINSLGIELLAKTGKADANNLLSPYSIQNALAMTYAGADGETRDEMARVLFFPKDGAQLNDSFMVLNRALDEIEQKTAGVAEASKKFGGPSEPIKLRVANRLFGQQGFDFRKPFLEIVKNDYGAPLETLDFEKDPGKATKIINLWVEEQTLQRIRGLIPDGALTNLTKLVLVNAIYLKAPWAKEFNKQATESRIFQISGTGNEPVPTMGLTSRIGYAKRDGYTAVTLPYIGGDLQFLILLPDEADGLAALEAKMDAGMLSSCAKLEARQVALFLPKFKMEPPTVKLNDQLQSLGMKTAFDIPPGSANFDLMAPRTPSQYLFIKYVFHKTFISVDENGTEAAAATAVVMMLRSAVMHEAEPVEVRVDHPFLFAIQHRPSGACLFLGRVTDPR